MKHLMTLVALLASTAAVAQDYPEFPFPYNPDGNADGYIGLSDLLDLLVVYGQEYPGSFYSDSTRAILDLGEMTYQECNQQAFMAGRSWRVLSQDDYYYWFKYFLDEGQEVFELGEHSGTYYYHTAWIRLKDGDPGHYQFQYGSGLPVEFNGTTYDVFGTSDNEQSFPSQKGNAGGSNRYEVFLERRCVLATEALPEIEYALVEGVEGVADSLSNGWKPLGGYSGAGQAIWRYAQ